MQVLVTRLMRCSSGRAPFKNICKQLKNQRIAAIANAIERVNARQRKILKTRRNFVHDEAVAKLL